MDLPEGLLIEDYETVRQKIVSFISSYMDRAGIESAMLGLSGGIDSSLVVTLACEAIGADRILGLMLPVHAKEDSGNVQDAITLADSLGIEHELYEIGPSLNTFRSFKLDKISIGNLTARLRMVALYAKANNMNGIVLGTGNKSEILTGYFTKYGDAGVDILPIGELYKVNVWGLAEHVGVPRKLIDKVPSAGLWAGQTDEGEMGVTYKELDSILYLRFDKELESEEIVQRGHSRESVDHVLRLVRKTQHKRDPIPKAAI
ncbi:MAG: NAD+ synthase [Candidatus Thorarchaeota archaeon]|jgi:NAD+ synthase